MLITDKKEAELWTSKHIYKKTKSSLLPVETWWKKYDLWPVFCKKQEKIHKKLLNRMLSVVFI